MSYPVPGSPPRALVRRALPVPSNAVVDLDFGQGVPLVDGGDTLTVTGTAAGESVSTGVTFSTARTMPIWSAFIGLFGPGIELGNASMPTYLVLPPNVFAPGDLYCGFAVAYSSCMNWQAEITAGGLGSDTSYTLPDWSLIHGDDGGATAGFAGQGFSSALVNCSMVAHSGDDPLFRRRMAPSSGPRHSS